MLNQCKFVCLHCHLDATPLCDTHLPLELVTRSLGEVEQLGIGTIYLSGGEPFLYPELPEVLALVSQQQGFELCVSTNGTLIGAAEAALLKDSGASVQVSINGPKAYHDRFRGAKGAFSRVSRGILQLVAAGVPVAIVITICQDNITVLPWLAKWAAETGVQRISVQPQG